PAQHVLRQVGTVYAQDQVLAPPPQQLALVDVDLRPLGDAPERVRGDRQRVGAHPGLTALEVDHARCFVDVQVEQLPAAEQEVAPVQVRVEADDVVRQNPLVEVLAHVARQHAPRV